MRIELIPAIDIIDGKCVRLTQGDYSSQKVYNENPVEVAREFADYGIRRLHIVDLDGAKSQHVVNLQVVEQIRSATDLVIDFGGGVKSDADLQNAFDAGADMVTIGSLAVKQRLRQERCHRTCLLKDLKLPPLPADVLHRKPERSLSCPGPPGRHP